VLVTRVALRDFRCYGRAELRLGPGITVLHGANGAGKTNLLEAVYFGCTGRSCRTRNERELVRMGSGGTARVEVSVAGEDGPHDLAVGLEPGAAGKRMSLDGASVERLRAGEVRPLISVFLPDRLELVKGPPAIRRAHLDQLIAARWPARAANRAAFRHALSQRNALLARARGASVAPSTLQAWDLELARHAVAVRADRATAAEELGGPFVRLAGVLGLAGEARVTYRPRSAASDVEGFVAELEQRRGSELERGITLHGPHRDELLLARDGHELRAYGSQGEQRLALLALLLAEREVLAASATAVPLMLLDDVMSELDADRRERLVGELAAGGQSVVTTTELVHVPVPAGVPITSVRVAEGTVMQEALAA
jgi:DNA replication and repair protein RecF